MDPSAYQRIADEIACKDNPSAIDENKAHVLILAKLESIERRLDALERAAPAREAGIPADVTDRLREFVELAPQAIATAADALDAEVAAAASRGQDVDRALRNGLQAALFFGERVSEAQLAALGKLLDSDVVHPGAIEMVGRAGRALVEAAGAPPGSAGVFGALGASGHPDVKRAVAFMIEFAKRFGAAIGDSTLRSAAQTSRRPATEEMR
ncbi:MAG: DUF1641 domain-containing protein [Phycisphaerae bacterium]|nr:DUF1641 domain-containing protein [Phycisphaerae bacterium]